MSPPLSGAQDGQVCQKCAEQVESALGASASSDHKLGIAVAHRLTHRDQKRDCVNRFLCLDPGEVVRHIDQ